MEKLSKSWFAEGRIDFEYKKYILLAYLKNVSRKFTKSELYPHLSELVNQYRNLESFLEQEQNLYEKFPGEIRGIDWQQFKIAYQKVVEDEELMESIRTIIKWSLPKVRNSLEEGKEIHDFIEKHMILNPVGIEPLNKDEGYLLVINGDDPKTRVFSYEVTLFENANEKYRSIRTRYLTDYRKTFTNTVNSIKGDLIRQFDQLPNPATYAVETELHVPLQPTFLPIAKRMLIRYLTKG